MLFTLNNIKGQVLMDSEYLKIFKVKESAIPSKLEDFEKNIADIAFVSNSAIHNHFGPRYPEFIVFSNSSYISDDQLREIETESLSSGLGSDLQMFYDIIKRHKIRDSNNICIENLFTVGRIRPNVSVSEMFSFHRLTGSVNIKISNGQFEIDIQNNNGQPTFLHFANEFENITVNTDNTNGVLTNVLKKIKNRMEMAGRVCSSYTVFKSSIPARNQIYLKSLQSMRIEDMLTFFGQIKKCQTKIETLAECLRGWATKYVPAYSRPLNKTFFIEIGPCDHCMESPYDFLPIDYILSNAAYMKIMASEAGANGSVRIIAQVVDKPVDDFAQSLYATMENSDKKSSSIKVVGIDESIINSSINLLKAEAIKAQA